MKKLKISIIMPSMNQGEYIEEAIKSVINQNYINYELIIIDGGSTDNTVDIIKKYSKFIKYWVSEKDNGQSEAINRGYSISTGDLVTWLNTDDVLMPNSLKKVSEKYFSLSENCSNVWIIGGLIWIDKNGRIMKCTRARTWMKWLFPGIIGVFGPSSFISREIINEIGFLDENFHCMMDTEYWMRMSKRGYRYTRISGYLWGYRLHKDSKMSGHNFKDSPIVKKDHPIWVKRKNEYLILINRYNINIYYNIRSFLINKIRLFLSPVAYLSAIETLIFINKDYKLITKFSTDMLGSNG